jgi:hypothetical protein
VIAAHRAGEALLPVSGRTGLPGVPGNLDAEEAAGAQGSTRSAPGSAVKTASSCVPM